jgi:hypothetical protein
MKTVEKITLWINYKSQEEVANKLADFQEYLLALLNTFCIESYTKLIKELLVIEIFYKKSTLLPEKNRVYYARKKAALQLFINADYDRLMQADERETLQIIAETYLKAIEIFLIPRKDFEGKMFYEDVKNLFEKEGILEKVE